MNPKITKLRDEIVALQTKLAAVESAGAPAVHTQKLLATQMDDLAIKYRTAISRLAVACIGARDDGDIRLRSHFDMTYGNPGEFLAGALVAHLGDKILEDVAAEMEFISPVYPAALADGDRDAELVRLRRELRSLGRQEEALIEAEELAGNFVERRPDADPVVVLGIPDQFCEEFGL